MMRQLALPLPIAASFDARDVIADASNAAARSWLAQPDTWPLGRLALYGEAGVGKTHLARAAAARFGWRWLDGMGLRGLPAPAPQGNVIDDADCVADEAALLHLINLCAERGESLLLIGRGQNQPMKVIAINATDMDAAALLSTADQYINYTVMGDAPPKENFN